MRNNRRLISDVVQLANVIVMDRVMWGIIKNLFTYKKGKKIRGLSNAPYYKKFPSKLDIRIIDSRGMISEKCKFVYFRIPKAANTTIITTLYKCEYGVPNDLLTIQDIKTKVYKKPSQLDNETVNTLFNDYFKFTFVRNPYVRLLSAYLDKIERSKPQKKLVANFFKKDIRDIITVNEFLDYLEFGGGIYKNGHWAPQVDMINFPVHELNFIGKVENLQNDLNEVMTKIFSFKIDLLTRDKHSTNSTIKFKDMIDSTSRKRIAKLYAEDFDIFKYPFDIN